jgi:nicotinate-nucleotide adenylyltransferase
MLLMNPAACKSIIIFGGSFDPPHVAHTDLARLAMDAIGADVTGFVPAGKAPHKNSAQTSGEDRLAMVRLATADEPRFFVIDDEVKRAADGRPSYTVETLAVLRERWGGGVKMRLLMGADMLRIFHQWREPARIVELAEPLVLVRPPDTRAGLLAGLSAKLPGGADARAWGSRVLELPPVDLSSTMVRERVARGEKITGMVAPTVEAYIREHGLYGGAGE